jgi:hypothetical protein
MEKIDMIEKFTSFFVTGPPSSAINEPASRGHLPQFDLGTLQSMTYALASEASFARRSAYL